MKKIMGMTIGILLAVIFVIDRNNTIEGMTNADIQEITFLPTPSERIQEINNEEDAFYRHNYTEGHSPYFKTADEIDGYSEDILLYYKMFQINNSQVFPEPHIGHIHDLNLICTIHEHPEVATYIQFEKKLENCDLFNEFFTKFMAPGEDWLKDRDYRDKEK